MTENQRAIDHLTKYYLNKLEHDKAYEHPTTKYDKSIRAFQTAIDALQIVDVYGTDETARIISMLRRYGVENSKWIHDAIAALEREQWQPIETAPKDGTRIQLWLPNERYLQYSRQYVGKWDDDKYKRKPRPYWDYGLNRVTQMRDAQPSHWKPLDDGPKEG